MSSAATNPSRPPADKNTILHLLLISGASGTGKSTLAYEICHRFRTGRLPYSQPTGGNQHNTTAHRPSSGQANTKIMHAHIAVDNLDALYPRPNDGELMLEVLRAQWGIFWRMFCETWSEDQFEREGEGGGGGVGTVGEQPVSREAVLVLDGTGIVLHLARVLDIVERVVNGHASNTVEERDLHPGLGVGTGSHRVEVRTTAILLEASSSVVEDRLRERVLGGELEQHLESTRKMRRVLDSWAADAIQDGSVGAGGGDGEGSGDGGERGKVVIKRVRSDRPLQEVVDEVLRCCGLVLSW